MKIRIFGEVLDRLSEVQVTNILFKWLYDSLSHSSFFVVKCGQQLKLMTHNESVLQITGIDMLWNSYFMLKYHHLK